MHFKILCSDLDGTLLSTKSDVSNFAISAISHLKSTTKIILVSARMPSGMHYIQRSLGILEQPIICYNGALIMQGDEELLSVTIPSEIVEQIYGLAAPLDTNLGLYGNNEWYVPNMSERVEKERKYTKTEPIFKSTLDTISDWKKRNMGAHKIMLMGTKDSADVLMSILQKDFGQRLNIYRSNDTLIEIAPKSVSKLSAIQQLLTNNESLKDIIAFGDNYNDIEMLEKVGHGVAVENAREEVKLIANAITKKNTEDGVAHYIQKHLTTF
ncbi:HAD family hydrolase [Maribacter sp. CXY002]|uniref:HAD family hydrolase n=1 Tax=Maribacter luteocoastalis TaxID=3407671 RepID=UPI003B674C1C